MVTVATTHNFRNKCICISEVMNYSNYVRIEFHESPIFHNGDNNVDRHMFICW